MKKNIQLQQGDVLISQSVIPALSKKIIKRPLAYGEVTNHSHQLLGDVDMYDLDGTLYFKVNQDVELLHEEHLPITIPVGVWEVGIVQEYDPFSEELKNVRD